MRAIRLFLLLCFAIVLLSFSACMTPPKGSAETGYTIYGFVGKSTTESAPGATVILLNGNTNTPIASKTTNFFGKYSFYGLQPGYYKVKTGDKIMEVVITNENQRLDIDLSSETGVMNYAAGAAKGVTPPGKPGGDKDLAQKFTGKWYSYSGASSITGGGGSESQLAFCPDGSYYDSYESGYYGSGGGGFGTASESGASGTWSVEGTADQGQITITYSNGSTTVIEYRRADDPQCYYFDGRLHCYNGSCD